MKRILGLDIGTNSVGWAIVRHDFDEKVGEIEGTGVRVIPMSQDVLGKFDAGQTASQTAERTQYRLARRLRQRFLLRRERLHRILNLVDWLPEHYRNAIDFNQRLGQFMRETKLPWASGESGKDEFLFKSSYHEMVAEFKSGNPEYFGAIPYDWTLYFLRKKALSQKITKEELAWVILSFNQKRGYYQSRDEVEETDAKREEFIREKVVKVEPTDDENSRGRWYHIHLSNGDLYKRQSKTDLSNWLGLEKEFIKTSNFDKEGNLKKDKEGNVKVSFRMVDSEKDWIAIKKKTENDLESSGLTVGAFIYSKLLSNPMIKVKGDLVRTVDRKYYQDELEAILKNQSKYHLEIADSELYQKCCDELYPKNEAHRQSLKDKNLISLLLEDIIFYQRPLRSQKSNVQNCQYEKRFYIKDGERHVQPLKGAPKSHPLFEEFRLWQFLSNLKIIKRVEGQNVDVDVTAAYMESSVTYTALFDALIDKPSLTQKQILKHFKLSESKFRWNFPEDQEYPCAPTHSMMLRALKDLNEADLNAFLVLGKVSLWHIVYSVKDKVQYEKAIDSFAESHKLPDSFVSYMKKVKPLREEYASYSIKALNKLLPLLRMGNHWSKGDIPETVLNNIQKLLDAEYDADITDRVREKVQHFDKIEDFQGLPVWLACYVVYGRHSEAGSVAHWKSPDDMDNFILSFKQHQLRNPIVEEVVIETLKVVRDLWDHYGKGTPDFFDEIHVELGREMKNSSKQRQRISKRQFEQRRTNERIVKLLEELSNNGVQARSYSPSHQEILKLYEEGMVSNTGEGNELVESVRSNNKPSSKDIRDYKLWLEQGYISPYTGQIIPLSSLFSNRFEIEHIIPRSRYFNDSLANKVICESEVNELKGNQTGLEFVKNHGGEVVALSGGKTVRVLEEEEYVELCQRLYKGNRSKLKHLLSEDIPEEFIERQLNDTRYISKYVKSLLGNIVRDEGENEATPKRLLAIPGSVTSILRKDWGLNDKWNEIIAPRFKRLNELTNSSDYGYWDESINAFRITVPEEERGRFNRKRIDHRHHALDALVVACVTRRHIQYLASLNSENTNFSLVKKLRHTKDKLIRGEMKTIPTHYKKPWESFPDDVYQQLKGMMISFKQNKRVINKATNRTLGYQKDRNGDWNKVYREQKGGNHWAVRKPLHKETIYGLVKDTRINVPKGKVATSVRTHLSEIKTAKHLKQIVDTQLREVIIPNHLARFKDSNGKIDFESAFNQEGLKRLNDDMTVLNNGKPHAPAYKVKLYEVGSKFPLGESDNKSKKYVEAAKGTNLFFSIYEKRGKDGNPTRAFESVPLNEVIHHQKLNAEQHLYSDATEVPIDSEKGEFLFSLSPEDIVRVGDVESSSYCGGYYKMVSCTGNQCFFVPIYYSMSIINNELGSNNKNERALFVKDNATEDMPMTKKVCKKLSVSRIGVLSE